MTCETLIDFLADYLEGRLPLGQRVAFEVHLALCSQCRAYLRNYQATIRASKAAYGSSEGQELPELPPELVEAITNALRDHPSSP